MDKKLIIFTFILFSTVLSTNFVCKTDEYCVENVNELYRCNPTGSTCQRIPVIKEFNFKSILGLFFVLSLILIAYVISISANSINMPLLVLMFEFTFKDTLAILKISNLLPSMFNFSMIANLRNPKKNNSLYTNFDLILFMYPLILAGSIGGTLLLLISPPIVSYSIVFVMLLVVSVRNFKKFQKLREKYKESLKEPPTGEPQVEIVPEDVRMNAELIVEPIPKKNESFFSLIYNVKNKILMIVLSLLILILAYMVKGNSTQTSIINNMECSYFTLCMFLVFCFPLVGISLFGYKKFQKSLKKENEENHNNNEEEKDTNIGLKMGISALVGGFISTVGVGGSLFVSSALLLLDVEPLVIKCTMTWITMLMATNNTFQFIFIGYFDWRNVLIFTFLGLIGCVSSNLFIKKLLANNMSSKANEIIALCCCLMSVFVCFAIPVTSYYEYKNNQSFLKAGSIC
jgi:uncharacterized membrane protein YfcA